MWRLTFYNDFNMVGLIVTQAEVIEKGEFEGGAKTP